MRIIILILIAIVFCFNANAQNVAISNINDLSYNLELIKFYIEKEEFENALEYIDRSLEETIEKDSLYFYKGNILQIQEEWLTSSEAYAQAIIYTFNEQIVDDRFNLFETVIVNVSPLLAFDVISSAVSEAQTTQKQVGFLKILAQLYEINQLYGEANDVYGTIMQDVETTGIPYFQIKIATNEIFLKEYNKALNTLEPLIAMNDSLNIPNLLFLNYIANISLENYEAAKKSLLRLYLDYPQNLNKVEILSGLVDVFEQQEQYIMSLYLLNELLMISGEAQKFNFQKDIKRIKQKIYENEIIEDQFKYFEPVFESEEKDLTPEKEE